MNKVEIVGSILVSLAGIASFFYFLPPEIAQAAMMIGRQPK